MRKDPRSSPAELRRQKTTAKLSCQKIVPHVMSGLFGSLRYAGIRGSGSFAIWSDATELRSYLVLRVDGDQFSIVPAEALSLEKLAYLSASGGFTLDSGIGLSKEASLQLGEAFSIGGKANLLKGRLRLISEMDDFDLSIWDDMPLQDVDFVIEEEGA